MTKEERAAAVKAVAKEVGFDLVGVASPDPLERERAYLLEWLRRGYAGTMSYLERELLRRTNPREILPDARSIIALALNYFPGEHGKPDMGSPMGRIAKYAAGRDYHQAVERKLHLLSRRMEQDIQGDFKFKYYVDTGPVLERPLAQRAGIGFTGKNTLTVARHYGSWIFLCELITNLELSFDKADLRDCGTCTLCIEACPTNAIGDPFQLDARRCISYLTIEHKGEIERTLRSEMQDWVFGCDVCQDVCPLNRQAKPHGTEELRRPSDSSRHNELWIKLEEVLNMRDDRAFAERFEGSPLRRPKRVGLLRNAAVAAGNSRREDLIPVLREAVLNDESDLVRLHAAWALGEMDCKEARETLLEADAQEESAHVAEEIERALNKNKGRHEHARR